VTRPSADDRRASVQLVSHRCGTTSILGRHGLAGISTFVAGTNM